MEKGKQNIVITTIISLITIISFAGMFISKQTTLEVQLANIQKELVNINLKLDKRDDEIRHLTERVIKLESEKGGN